MSTERFTKEQFEQALPRHNDTGEPLWSSLGLVSGEFSYLVRINGGKVSAEIRSSVDVSGIAADTGKDSIRAWLVDTETRKPIGSKVSRWTTRKKGWNDRLTDVLRTLWQWRMRAGDCPECREPKGIYKVKKDGANKGRPFANCRSCNSGFVWLDEAPKAKPYFSESPTEAPTEADEPNVGTTDDSPVSVDGEGENNQSEFALSPSISNIFGKKVVVIEEEEEAESDTDLVVAPTQKANEHQLEAITAPINGAVRVLAPPGSGKTFVIANRYAHLVSNGVDPDNILAVTFSKTMANELLSRIRKLSPEIADTSAERQICTIHAICYRMLKDCGDRRSVAKDWMVKKAIEELAEKSWPYSNERPGWKEIYHWINIAKFDGLSSSDDLSFYISALGEYHGRNVHDIRRQFDNRMRDQRLLTFPDMLFDVEQKLDRDKAFRERWQAKFQYLITDEGQDTSRQAMRILATIAQPQNNFFIVGDSDQALYRFCGSVPEDNLFDGFDERYSKNTTVKLSINYRSTREIIDRCQSLIKYNYSSHNGPYDQEYFKDVSPRDDADDGEIISFAEYANSSDEAVNVANTIREALSNGSEPGNIFVCARTRAQLGYIEGPLVRAKIPFINICGGSFWGSKHVADVVAYLRLAFNHKDIEAFGRIYNIASNWNTHPWGEKKGEYCNHRYLGRAFLDACSGNYDDVWNAVSRRKSFRPGVEDLTSFVNELEYTMAQAETPAEVIRQIIDDCYRKWLVTDEGITISDDAENGKLEDLETVVDVASQFETVEEFLDYVKDAVKAAEDARNKDWNNYVVLSTVHRLKGLEREIVFVLGCSEGVEGDKGLLPHTFSLVEPVQNGVLPTGGKGRIEDERCIMFVAVSRAKEKVYLSSIREYREVAMMPSRFIDELGLRKTEDKND